MAIEAPAKSADLSELESPALLRLVRVEYVVLAAIVLVGLGIRAYFDFGLVKVDPFTYADAAGSIARGQPIYDSDVTGSVYYTQYIRLSLILPAALLYKVFGPSDFASTVWPVALSLGMAVMAYFAARMISGRTAGLVAAAAVCFFPLNVINSTQFLPDIVLAAFSSLATVCFIAATELPNTTRKQRFWLYVGVGASIALACYARATAASLLPGIAMILVARKRVGFDVLGIAAGAGVVFALAQVFLLSYGASLFEDIRVLRAESDSSINLHFDYARIFLTDRMFWPFFVASGVGLALFAWRRGPLALYRTAVFPLMVLIAFQYIYIEFIMSLPAVSTWWKEPRYALPIVFPVLVIGAAGWAEALRPALADRRNLATGLAAVAIGVLAIAAIPPIAEEYDFYIHEDGNRVDFDQRLIADVIPEGATVYAWDDDFARPLSYRLGLAGTLYERMVSDSGTMHARLDSFGRSKVTPGSYVVTLPREQWWPLPTAPAEHWELVWTSPSGVTVHRVPSDPNRVTLVSGAMNGQVRWSVAWAVPQQHVVGELALAAPAAEATTASVHWACAGQVSRGYPVNIPGGATLVRFEAPFDIPPGHNGPCEARLVMGGETVTIGTLAAPNLRVVELESLAAVSGWQSFNAAYLSLGSGLIGSAGATGEGAITALPSGDYRVEMLVYDYATGFNEIEIALNGVTGGVRWGSDDGGAPGMRRVSVRLRDVPAGGELTFRVMEAGQDAVIVDAVAVIDRDVPGDSLVSK